MNKAFRSSIRVFVVFLLTHSLLLSCVASGAMSSLPANRNAQNRPIKGNAFAQSTDLLLGNSAGSLQFPGAPKTNPFAVDLLNGVGLDRKVAEGLAQLLNGLDVDYYKTDKVEIAFPVPGNPTLKLNFGFAGSGDNKFEALPSGTAQLITDASQNNADSLAQALLENALHKYLNSINKELASWIVQPKLSQSTVFALKLCILLKDYFAQKLELPSVQNEIFYLLFRLSLVEDLHIFDPKRSFSSHIPTFVHSLIPVEIKQFLDETWTRLMQVINTHDTQGYLPQQAVSMQGFGLSDKDKAESLCQACQGQTFDGDVRKVIADKGYEIASYEELVALGDPLSHKDPVCNMVAEKAFTGADAEFFPKLTGDEFTKIVIKQHIHSVPLEGKDGKWWLLQPSALGALETLQTALMVFVKAFKEHLVLQNDFFRKNPQEAKAYKEARELEGAHTKFLATAQGIASVKRVQDSIKAIEQAAGNASEVKRLQNEIQATKTELQQLRGKLWVQDIIKTLEERLNKLKNQLVLVEKKKELEDLAKMAQKNVGTNNGLQRMVELQGEISTMEGVYSKKINFEALLVKNKKIAAVYIKEAQSVVAAVSGHDQRGVQVYSDELKRKAQQMERNNTNAEHLLFVYGHALRGVDGSEMTNEKKFECAKFESEIASLLSANEPNMITQFLEKSFEFKRFIADITSDIPAYAPIKGKLRDALKYLWENSEPVKENPVLFKYIIKSKFPALFPLLEEIINKQITATSLA